MQLHLLRSPQGAAEINSVKHKDEPLGKNSCTTVNRRERISFSYVFFFFKDVLKDEDGTAMNTLE